MEESIVDMLGRLLDTRSAFFNNTINRIGHTHRDALLSRFFLNESCFLELTNRLHQNHIRARLLTQATQLTFNLPSNFLDPIVVAPTSSQILAAIDPLVLVPPNTQCAICQDAVTGDASQIRHCHHTFHTQCLTTWFTMSVRCPVCRYDVRGEGQASQTSSADE